MKLITLENGKNITFGELEVGMVITKPAFKFNDLTGNRELITETITIISIEKTKSGRIRAKFCGGAYNDINCSLTNGPVSPFTELIEKNAYPGAGY